MQSSDFRDSIRNTHTHIYILLNACALRGYEKCHTSTGFSHCPSHNHLSMFNVLFI